MIVKIILDTEKPTDQLIISSEPIMGDDAVSFSIVDKSLEEKYIATVKIDEVKLALRKITTK